ncbi:MAG: cytochrome C oxidase subunit IV family protein [Chloroflexi bacterium OHK40]
MATTNPTHSADGHGAGTHDEHAHGHIGRGTYFRVFGALMVLMILTVVAFYVEPLLGFNRLVGVIIAMAIACTKTALIVLYFMHIKISERITQLYAAASFVGFALLVIIVMIDYFARGWPPAPGPLP